MADKAQTPPPTTIAGTSSSPLTPNPKRARMSSPDKTVEQPEKDTKEEGNQSKEDEDAGKSVPSAESARNEQPQSTEAAPQVTSTQPLTEKNNQEDDEQDELEADDGYADSAFGGSENSDSTSITSSITQGIVENGRRYQAKREGEYWGPADDKQFLSMEAAHIVYLLLEHKRKNPYFLSPIPETAQNILDLGTGSGIWAKEVADEFPSIVVQGVDLSPPPQDWVPPNCKLEVDDFLKPWDYSCKFDLVHIRDLFGSCSDEQWRLTYKQAYNNIVPGGWIEQAESAIKAHSDDGSMLPESIVGTWEATQAPAFAKMGKPINTCDMMKSRIEAAGFINVHEKIYKVPLGDWAKDPVLKEVGRFFKTQVMEGMEGYVMFIMTHFADPTPWTPEEVHVYLAKARQEINDPKLHAYFLKRRVWAQKPFDEVPKAESKTEVENLP